MISVDNRSVDELLEILMKSQTAWLSTSVSGRLTVDEHFRVWDIMWKKTLEEKMKTDSL